MTGIVSALANLIEALDAVPGYPFRPDVKKAAGYLEKYSPASEDVAALHLRGLVDGARSIDGFVFKGDLLVAEAALRAYRPGFA
ncbi:hypothetical protein G6L37_05365 [Agrobacterium rubi]|nr:hypothetical protein [Agrobacterium rubi]NTF24786.1 hypothetical protein [Agrobacterium rubi]